MNKRDSIIDSFKSSEDRVLVARIIDCVEHVERYYEPRFTRFLDPAEVYKSKKVIQNYDVNYIVTSGVEGCERNIIAIFPDYMEKEQIEIPVSVLEVYCKNRFETVNHRDMLGALMGLGIKRENIGDIIQGDERYYVFVCSDICNYILMNLTMAKHTPLSVTKVGFEQVPNSKSNYKEIVSNVASLRLDSILKIGFGESRSSISKKVLEGDVKVNYEENRELSYPIKEGDVISLKGKGRIIVGSVGGTTKKGRINVVIKRLI